nr:MAG: replication associated protein [Cressdnaviricota sp.]
MTHLTQVDTERKGNTDNLSSRTRSRRWCYTLNNYTVEEFDTLTHTFSKEKYSILGKEIGESGTPHLQGYVEFKNARTLNSLKKINSRIHWEKAKGTKLDNIAYCSKDGIVTEKKEETQVELENRLRLKCLNDTSRNNGIPKDIINAWINYDPSNYY